MSRNVANALVCHTFSFFSPPGIRGCRIALAGIFLGIREIQVHLGSRLFFFYLFHGLLGEG